MEVNWLLPGGYSGFTCIIAYPVYAEICPFMPGGYGGFTCIIAYPMYAEICPFFPPPEIALAAVATGEKGALSSMV